MIHRGAGDRLDEAAQRLLLSTENRVHIPLGGLERGEVAALATALMRPLAEEVVQRLYRGTGGHPLYVRTVLSEGSGFDPLNPVVADAAPVAGRGPRRSAEDATAGDPGHSGDARGAEPAVAAGPAGPGSAS